MVSPFTRGQIISLGLMRFTTQSALITISVERSISLERLVTSLGQRLLTARAEKFGVFFILMRARSFSLLLSHRISWTLLFILFGRLLDSSWGMLRRVAAQLQLRIILLRHYSPLRHLRGILIISPPLLRPLQRRELLHIIFMCIPL